MASGDTLIVFTARDSVPTLSAWASHTIITGASSPAENVPCLSFDSATDEHADFSGVMPRNYAGGGLTLYLHWASGVTTGATVWNAAFRRIQDDAENLISTAHTYDFNAVTATTASAFGEFDYATITFTNGADMDSLAVGESFILRIARDANNGSDDMVGDAYLVAIEIKET